MYLKSHMSKLPTVPKEGTAQTRLEMNRQRRTRPLSCLFSAEIPTATNVSLLPHASRYASSANCCWVDSRSNTQCVTKRRNQETGMHKQAESRAGNNQRNTRTTNFSPPTQANNAARAINGNPPTWPLYMHLPRSPMTEQCVLFHQFKPIR